MMWLKSSSPEQFLRRVKSPCFLFNKNIDFNKNKTESKMENSTHIVKGMNLVLRLA